MTVVDLRCDTLTNPLGLDSPTPRLSWKLDDTRMGARQSAFQIQVATSEDDLMAGDNLTWDSGKVESDNSIHVRYGGEPCTAWTAYVWRVRIWDASDAVSPWSTPASWEMGPLTESDWGGTWIGSSPRQGEEDEPSPYLRTEFPLSDLPISARLAITARGSYEMWANGKRVGDALLTPGWTDYNIRIPYQVYDVTHMLVAGKNCLGGILADGWYAGNLMGGERRCLWGKDLSLLATLRMTYADGRIEALGTHDGWCWATGAILSADHYDGEIYDARKAWTGWCEAGFDDAAWQAVTSYPEPEARLVAKPCRPVRCIETLPAQTCTESRPGHWVYDFGQNMVGWVRIRLSAPAGARVTLRHAEMLQENGEIYTENLRGAKCTDIYICRGDGEEVYEPRFTFHGFRYVEIQGLDSALALDAVHGRVIHTELPETGVFECSNAMVNQLQSNIRWGQKGNFLEVPTDCPQRNERLGWTGDAQIFARTACFNMDVSAFFAKYCQDLEDAQTPQGRFPHVAPDVLGDGGSPAWADAGVIVPWTMYLCYGDVAVLDRHFDAMAKWVDFMEDKSVDLIWPETGFGDWLSIDEGTSRALIGTAYFARCSDVVARAAGLTGRSDRAEPYRALSERVVAAFNREFVTPGGRLSSHSQTGYLLALGFNLLPENKREAAVSHLVADIESRDWHLSTGFVGTPLLAPVLTKVGRVDVAYKLLLQESYPSWFYPIHNGATTMWERWNSYTKEDGFGSAEMNSFNHYAYGAIGEWLYATVGGLNVDPEQPGYKHAVISPEPGGNLTWARTELETVYGKLACRWEVSDSGLSLDVVVPPNTTATLRLPVGLAGPVRVNGAEITAADGVSELCLDNNRVSCELAAGKYHIDGVRMEDDV